jgi:hypothetical protein
MTGTAQRRHLGVALVVALLAAPLALARPAQATPAQATATRATATHATSGDVAARRGGAPWERPGWKLRWSPRPERDGLRAFEHIEDDRAGSDPAGAPHIFVEGDHYRFNMNMNVRDTSPDRQRNEVRGNKSWDHALNLLKGGTWRFTYSMYIPDTLKATTSFSHIMQMKMPGTGSLPIIVESLRRYGTVQKMELKVAQGDVLVGAVDLEPLQNHWVDIEFEMKIGDAPDGSVRWVVRDGARTVIDKTTTGVDTWMGDRVRAKWGIYRSLGDKSGSLQDTYMLIKNLRAYQWSDTFIPPVNLRYEAERATIRDGVVENASGGYTGSGYVNYADAAGGYVEWKVFAFCDGPAALNLWYANATTTVRPMDITVNGTVIAPGLAFDRTPAWNDWETRTLVTNLHAGINIIRATATTGAGGPNLDSLEVQQPATAS